MPRKNTSPQIDPELGAKLKRARQLKSMTQGQLAQRIGADVQRISKYERGVLVPTTVILVKLADALGVTTDYLIRGGEDRAVTTVRDPALLARFTEIDALSKQDRQVLLVLIDAFIKKKRFEDLAAS